MAATATGPWLQAKPAADRLGVTVYRLHNLALAGAIRTKTEPGQTPRFHAEDVDRLASQAKDRSPNGE